MKRRQHVRETLPVLDPSRGPRTAPPNGFLSAPVDVRDCPRGDRRQAGRGARRSKDLYPGGARTKGGTTVKIYLAGPITPGDWREEFVDRNNLVLGKEVCKHFNQWTHRWYKQTWKFGRESFSVGLDAFSGWRLARHDTLRESENNTYWPTVKNGFYRCLDYVGPFLYAEDSEEQLLPHCGPPTSLAPILEADIVFGFLESGPVDPVLCAHLSYAIGLKKIVLIGAHYKAQVPGPLADLFINYATDLDPVSQAPEI